MNTVKSNGWMVLRKRNPGKTAAILVANYNGVDSYRRAAYHAEFGGVMKNLKALNGVLSLLNGALVVVGFSVGFHPLTIILNLAAFLSCGICYLIM